MRENYTDNFTKNFIKNELNIKDYILVSLLVFLWLIPVIYVNTTRKDVPYLGKYLNDKYRLSCLFSSSAKRWHNLYFEIQLDNNKEWIWLPDDEYFQMEPFGHRKRLKQIYTESFTEDRMKSDAGKLRREQMAQYIKDKHEKLYPKKGEVTALRFVGVEFQVGEEEIRYPKGKWKVKPLPSYDNKRKKVYSAHRFQNSFK